MIKGILPVFGGMATSMVVIFLMEAISHMIYPMPKVDYKDKAALAEMVSNMPPGAFACLLIGYAFGSFSGGLVAAMMASENRLRSGLIVGAVVMLGGIMNIVMIPHPLWFAIATFFAYIPFAYLGGYIVQKAKSK